jgi:small subunit ribosomal protein S15
LVFFYQISFLQMAIYYSKEKVASIVTEHGGAGNTGSTEAQIALFTFRILSLSEHLKTNKHDNSCRRTLLTLVGRRRRALTYLSKSDITKYRALIEKLGIRK